VPPAPAQPATGSYAPWTQHPTLTALHPSLQITADCWALLAALDGTSRKEHYLPKGEREPDTAYRKRLDAARLSGFFRDALRTYAGMLSRGSWISLPASLSSVFTNVDGQGTDLGVILASADLLVLRNGAALVLVLPPEHSWPSEGDRQEALRRGDRLSLPRLQLVPRANCLNWEMPVSYGLPGRIIWKEPVNRPISCKDLPSDASIEFVEIRARSLAEHRAWLQILDDTMRRDALILSQKRGAACTQMVIILTASQS
jgi:hypothetical protein